MTDQQILTLCLSIAIPLALLIFSNSRVTDAKEILRAETALGFERLSNKLDHLAGEVATLKELLETHLSDHHGIK
ncbi:MAG: hypothetical protein JOZ22_17890 [Acidobacteriia bacterium]|nr:hypothetical protein [Terriglobia bacterium]MBV9744875.1 hypothetical protein [Terriglobia bacterium]